MKAIFLPMLVAAASPPVVQPHMYLISMRGIPLGPGERIDRFEISTWGVNFKAVCRIPKDWEIKSGSFGPEGTLTGEAGHGASYLDDTQLTMLNDLVLVSMDGPIHRFDKRDQTGVVPATFSGTISVKLPNDTSKKIAVTFRAISMKPASHCPMPNLR